MGSVQLVIRLVGYLLYPCDSTAGGRQAQKCEGADLKIATHLSMLIAAFLLLAGCTGGGDDPAVEAACYDMCDRMDQCDIDDFDDEQCERFCRSIQDFTDDREPRCEDGHVILFECAEDATCEDLKDLEQIATRDVLVGILSGLLKDCELEAFAAIDSCIPEAD